jgi:hypothetical protein
MSSSCLNTAANNEIFPKKSRKIEYLSCLVNKKSPPRQYAGIFHFPILKLKRDQKAVANVHR